MNRLTFYQLVDLHERLLAKRRNARKTVGLYSPTHRRFKALTRKVLNELVAR